jgi:hypothetical protein
MGQIPRLVAFGDWSHSEIGRILGNSGIGRSEIGRSKIGCSEIGRLENGRSEIGRCTNYLYCLLLEYDLWRVLNVDKQEKYCPFTPIILFL